MRLLLLQLVLGCGICNSSVTISCPAIFCERFKGCPNGYEKDEYGCETCVCKRQRPTLDCPIRQCPSDCQYVIDARGCPDCYCTQGSTLCDIPTCRMLCPNGFERDANGCKICKCKEQMLPTVCPLLMCELNCQNGYEMDEGGCEMCMCKRSPIGVCLGRICFK